MNTKIYEILPTYTPLKKLPMLFHTKRFPISSENTYRLLLCLISV